MRPKFGDVTGGEHPFPVRHAWKPIYDRRKSGKSEKVVATVVGSGIDLNLKLTEICPEPIGILYVLLVPRNAEAGRYQLKEWLDRSSLNSCPTRMIDPIGPLCLPEKTLTVNTVVSKWLRIIHPHGFFVAVHFG